MRVDPPGGVCGNEFGNYEESKRYDADSLNANINFVEWNKILWSVLHNSLKDGENVWIT